MLSTSMDCDGTLMKRERRSLAISGTFPDRKTNCLVKKITTAYNNSFNKQLYQPSKYMGK